MFQIGGIIFLFATVFGGYVLSGGHFEVILHALPHEVMTIFGAAVGALLIASSGSALEAHLRRSRQGHLRPEMEEAGLRDLLCLLFLLTKTMKTKGMIALEQHIEKPTNSTIFKRYPRIAKDHFALDFICDTLRMMTMSLEDPHQVETAMEKQLEKHHHEALIRGACAAEHGRRPAGARHRRRRARRHQDHGLDHRAAGNSRRA